MTFKGLGFLYDLYPGIKFKVFTFTVFNIACPYTLYHIAYFYIFIVLSMSTNLPKDTSEERGLNLQGLEVVGISSLILNKYSLLCLILYS